MAFSGDQYRTHSFGDLAVDQAARQVFLGGEPVHLTRTEFDLLSVFVNSPRRAFSREQLIELVWGGTWYGRNHMVNVHISNLRRKIGDSDRVPPLIHTLHGVGYRFDGQADLEGPTTGERRESQ
jgi:DNA-binding response OmpR family regulator